VHGTSLQQTKQGALVGAFHGQTYKFEVYSPDMSKYALFIYQVGRQANHTA